MKLLADIIGLLTTTGATMEPTEEGTLSDSELLDPLKAAELDPKKGHYRDSSSTEGALGLSEIARLVVHEAQAPAHALGLSDDLLTGREGVGPETGPKDIEINVAREEKLARQFTGLGMDLGKEAAKKKPERVAEMKRTSKPAQPEEERTAAIEASGIVGGHAKAMSDVATLRGEIIMTRPVNKDCTKLIEDHAATKHLHIKSKSTDWGPAAGYIPADGRYSKLGNPSSAKLDDKTITGMKKSTEAAEHSTEEGWTIELAMVQVEGKAKAKELGSLSGSDLVWGIPKMTKGEWTSLKEVPAPELMTMEELSSSGKLKPLTVLGDPGSKQPIAADYDLFAIGERRTETKGGTYKPDAHMGVLTDRQKGTVMDVNAAVMATGHKGGRVAHHGTETQNPFTELDFPLTAFEPDGSVRSIKNQLELVDYFNEMHALGYNLQPNAKWLTEPTPPSGDIWSWSKWSGSPGKWKILPKDLHKVKGEA